MKPSLNILLSELGKLTPLLPSPEFLAAREATVVAADVTDGEVLTTIRLEFNGGEDEKGGRKKPINKFLAIRAISNSARCGLSSNRKQAESWAFSEAQRERLNTLSIM